MPSRGIVAAILLLWLGSTSLLITREIVPRWRMSEAPAYSIDITDEVGAPQAEWEVVHRDQVIGRGYSQIRRREDRTFDMGQRFKFSDLELPVLVATLVVRKLESNYHVTRDGNLLGLHVQSWARLKNDKGDLPVELEAEIVAKVEDGLLRPQLRVFGTAVEVPGLRPVDVSEHGNVLNPMHLVHRLPGLREGQRWRVPLLDPLKMFSAKELIGHSLGGAAFPHLEAEVDLEILTWNKEDVPCLRIQYREPGKDIVAATWVRRRDGLVLAQQAKHAGYEFMIRRLPGLGS